MGLPSGERDTGRGYRGSRKVTYPQGVRKVVQAASRPRTLPPATTSVSTRGGRSCQASPPRDDSVASALVAPPGRLEVVPALVAGDGLPQPRALDVGGAEVDA